MRILVTGGAGYVGSNLIKRILNDHPDYEIHSLDNYFTGTASNEHEGAVYHYGNTKEISKILGDMQFHTVYHFGEYSRIVPSFEDIKMCFDFDVTGTFEILEFCRTNAKKIIYSGSSSKFGEGNENLSPYSWMKAKNIELIKNYKEWFNLDYEVVYFYNVYGDNHIKTGKYATVIGIFEDKYEKNQPIPIVGDGSQSRDFTHITDIVDGIYRASMYGKGDGEYFLGTGTNWTLKEVAQMFEKFGATVKHIDKRRGERISSIIPNMEANEYIGFKSTIELDEYVKNICHSMKLSNTLSI
jgi:UDP-glucose 4-epimerase